MPQPWRSHWIDRLILWSGKSGFEVTAAGSAASQSISPGFGSRANALWQRDMKRSKLVPRVSHLPVLLERDNRSETWSNSYSKGQEDERSWASRLEIIILQMKCLPTIDNFFFSLLYGCFQEKLKVWFRLENKPNISAFIFDVYVIMNKKEHKVVRNLKGLYYKSFYIQELYK